VRNGQLLPGKGSAKDMMTTLDALAQEQRILSEVEAGRGAVAPVLGGDVAAQRLQDMAEAKFALRLNGGQEAAGRLILSSANRTVAVQGIAGSGKSTLLRPLAEILREEGRTVIGLAVQNTLVQMLERDTGISSMTVARFLRQHRELLGASPPAAKLADARGQWAGSVVLLDEASMVGNADQEQLVRLANLLELQRFAMIGDRKQLGAVDAGKPFALLQARGVSTAAMGLNIRARDETLRQAQYAAQAGEVGNALELLRPHTIETAGNLSATAAERWLALAPEDRARTAIYVAGRRLRGEVNAAVQDGRLAAGELGTDKMVLETLVRVNATREELRHVGTYTVGQVVQFAGSNRAQGLKAGEHRIEGIDARAGVLQLSDTRGDVKRFRPARLRPGQERDPLELYERQQLAIHVGDPIRWTANDHQRGLFNADRAEVIGLGKDGVAIRTSAGVEQTLARGDPMLRRLDLAYALNAHMAQGLTSDRGIAVMDSAERKLASKQTFLVTITRLRDSLTLIVDSGERLERAVERNPGVKTSAIESVDQGKDAAKAPTVESTKPKDERQLERSRSRTQDYGL
jgi:ATP-dependent exoDNAse (exonuclease V) alpha subunit